MSADFNTTITLRGNSEELFAMLKVLKKFEKGNLEWHIDYVIAQISAKEYHISDMNDKKIMEFINKSTGEISISASGPYGTFCNPKETRLFEALAEAAPEAEFDGEIRGFNYESEFEINGKLIAKKLHLSGKTENNDDIEEVKRGVYDPIARTYTGNYNDDMSDAIDYDDTSYLNEGYNKGFNIVDNVLERYVEEEGITEIVIPDNVTEIEEAALSCNKKLRSVIISDGVTLIGRSVFEDCKNLQSVIIPNSVTEIEEYAFCNCTSLQLITIPDSITEIESCTFDGCSSLQSIIIPDSVVEIGEDAFDGCDELVITAPAGSYAIEYAKENDIAYKEV